MVDQITQLSMKPGKLRLDAWSVAMFVIAAIVLLPLVAVVVLALFPSENIWGHLVSTTLPRYLRNSFILTASVGALTSAMGAGAAWLIVTKRFPLRRVLEWALLMPLAIPAYIGAYALVDFLEYAGPVQTTLRGWFGWQTARDYWFPEIRSIWAAIFVLSMALYPYVYLMARAAFREQSGAMTEVSRALGCGPWGSFWRVALPLARPAIVAGAAIVMMETLNDFGTVDYFAVQTLTTGIFSVWLQSYNAGGAAQIACMLLGIVFALAALERLSRNRRRYHSLSSRQSPMSIEVLHGWRGWGATIACFIPVMAGFVLPIAVVLSHAFDSPENWVRPALWRATMHTFSLAASAAAITVLAGLAVVYGARQSRSRLPRLLLPVTTIGYAAPGAVLAIGILMPMAGFDNWLADRIVELTGYDIGLLFTGSAAAVVFAYTVRFFAIAEGAADSALGRVTPSMDMAARSLGRTAGQSLRDVHIPLIRGSMLTAGLLVFVDAAKELPATLILRPFDFDTLSTLVYAEASLENLGNAAPAAIFVTIVGLLPVAILARQHRADWRSSHND